MNCKEARELIELHALGALEAEERCAFDLHIHDCRECRELAEKAVLVADEAACRLKSIEANQRGVDEALARVDLEIDRQRSLSVRMRWSGIVFRAAAVLAVCATGLLLAGYLTRPDAATPASAVVKWQTAGIEAFSATKYPVLCGSSLIVVQRDNNDSYVSAVRKESGDGMWRKKLDGVTAVLTDSQRVYAMCWNGSGQEELVALDGSNGRELWRRAGEVTRQAWSRPCLVLVNGGVCWAEAGTVSLYDAGTGAQVWTKTIGGPDLTVSGGHGRVFVASGNTISALKCADGQTIWTDTGTGTGFRLGRPFICSDNESVYLARTMIGGAGRGELVCYDAEKGSRTWRKETSTPMSLSVARSKVYLRSKELDVFDTKDGRQLWSASLVGCSPVAASGDVVLVLSGRANQDVVALDPDNGHTVWTNRLAGSCSGMVIDAGNGFFCGHDGVLYAIDIGGRG